MAETVRVLHVDDDPEFAEFASTVLERETAFTVETAPDATAALARLEEAPVDAVVSDYEMPGRDGLELLAAVREDYPDLPFILYTGRGSEELASRAVSAGVTDYLQKGTGTSQFDVLANRVRNAVEQYRSRRGLERTEAVLEAAGDAVYALDLDGRLTTVNATLVEWTGYSRDQLLGSHASLVLDDADVERGRQAVSDLVAGEREVDQFEGTLHAADGDTVPIEARVTLLEEEGVVEGSTGVLRDIAARKEREWELERYRSIFEGLEDAVYVLDEAETLVYVNDSYAALKGVDRDRLVGTQVTEWADPETVERVREVRAEVSAGERTVGTVEKVVTGADGERIPAELRITNLTRDDGRTERVGVIRDIADRKEYERRLAALNETSQELLAAETRQGVAETAVETAKEVLGLDANAVHLYDADREALVPVAMTDASRELVGDPPNFTAGGSIAWRVYQEGEPLAVDDVHDDPDVYNPDSPVRAELYLPLGESGILIAGSRTPETFDQRDVVLGEILAGNVVTAFDQLERTAQLRERERELTRQNERLADFAGVVSHDLRNPLNVAQARVDLASEDCDSEHLEAAADALDRSQALIDDLLALAREGESANDPVALDLADLATDCWDTVETDEATLRAETDRTVRADESRLRQLFENLIRNSVEHAGPDVTVTVGDCEGGFYLEDDGPGIPEGERGDVFDPGYSTSQAGTGFGLPIVDEIAESHGWSVRVTEGSAGGARFEITGVEFV